MSYKNERIRWFRQMGVPEKKAKEIGGNTYFASTDILYPAMAFYALGGNEKYQPDEEFIIEKERELRQRFPSNTLPRFLTQKMSKQDRGIFGFMDWLISPLNRKQREFADLAIRHGVNPDKAREISREIINPSFYWSPTDKINEIVKAGGERIDMNKLGPRDKKIMGYGPKDVKETIGNAPIVKGVKKVANIAKIATGLAEAAKAVSNLGKDVSEVSASGEGNIPEEDKNSLEKASRAISGLSEGVSGISKTLGDAGIISPELAKNISNIAGAAGVLTGGSSAAKFVSGLSNFLNDPKNSGSFIQKVGKFVDLARIAGASSSDILNGIQSVQSMFNLSPETSKKIGEIGENIRKSTEEETGLQQASLLTPEQEALASYSSTAAKSLLGELMGISPSRTAGEAKYGGGIPGVVSKGLEGAVSGLVNKYVPEQYRSEVSDIINKNIIPTSIGSAIDYLGRREEPSPVVQNVPAQGSSGSVVPQAQHFKGENLPETIAGAFAQRYTPAISKGIQSSLSSLAGKYFPSAKKEIGGEFIRTSLLEPIIGAGFQYAGKRVGDLFGGGAASVPERSDELSGISPAMRYELDYALKKGLEGIPVGSSAYSNMKNRIIDSFLRRAGEMNYRYGLQREGLGLQREGLGLKREELGLRREEERRRREAEEAARKQSLFGSLISTAMSPRKESYYIPPSERHPSMSQALMLGLGRYALPALTGYLASKGVS